MQRPADLFSWKNLSAILVVLVSVILVLRIVSDNRKFFINPEAFSIQSPNGLYLSANACGRETPCAGSITIGHWERFSIARRGDGTVIISDYSGKALGPGKFYFEPSGPGVLIKDCAGQYFHIDEQFQFVPGPHDAATVFTVKPANVHIPTRDYFLVISGLLCLFLSVVLFQVCRRTWPALLILMAGAFLLMVYCITMFDFLFLWDEQYHALVAKNLILNPLKPLLYHDPLVTYNYRDWTMNHVWLHKQPMFLWQMAVSIKVFGLHAWAVRVPDLVMMVILVCIIYRMGSLVADRDTGFWAAFFFTGSDFLFRLVSGGQYTDHNDVAFLFYVTLSIWAWLEFENSETEREKWIFLCLTGIFAGFSVLVKWLPGLLVFAGWGIHILVKNQDRNRMRSYLDLFLALLISLIVFIPWQIYIFMKFPLESLYEFKISASHFLSPVEGHSGDGLGWYYYLQNSSLVFGISWKVMLACMIVFLAIAKRKYQAVSLLFMVFFVYFFYSSAQTKMPAFIFILAGLVYIIFSSFYTLIQRMLILLIPGKGTRILFFTIILVSAFDGLFKLNTKYTTLYTVPCDTAACLQQRTTFAKWYQEFDKVIPEADQHNYVILNCAPDESIHMMFFTGIRAAYGKIDIPSFNTLKQRPDLKIGYIVYPDEKTPDFILNDPSILKIYPERGISLKMTGGCR